MYIGSYSYLVKPVGLSYILGYQVRYLVPYTIGIFIMFMYMEFDSTRLDDSTLDE